MPTSVIRKDLFKVTNFVRFHGSKFPAVYSRYYLVEDIVVLWILQYFFLL